MRSVGTTVLGLALLWTGLWLGPWIGKARAWTPIDPERPVWIGPVPYTLNSAGARDLGGFGPTERILQQAMNDWESLSCTSLRTEYRGATDALPGQGESYVIAWVESGWPETSSAIGVTGPYWDQGHIRDAVILMNADHFAWSEENRSGTVHAYSIMLHELGHYLGLDHSEAGNVMKARYGGGVIAIGADDRTGLCALYPAADDPGDCTSSACPDEYECVGGTCVWSPMGDGTQCAPCRIDNDCNGAGRCIRYPDVEEHGYCGDLCASQSDCGLDRCEAGDVRAYCIRRGPDDVADCRLEPGVVVEPPPVDAGTMVTDAGVPMASDAGPADEPVPSPDGGPVDPSTADPKPMGGTCLGNDDCISGTCVSDPGEALGSCTDICDSETPCPEGFRCREEGYCEPTGKSPPVAQLKGGCAVGTPDTGTGIPAALLLLVLIFGAVHRPPSRS